MFVMWKDLHIDLHDNNVNVVHGFYITIPKKDTQNNNKSKQT